MDIDFELIIYIVFVLVAILSRALKKKKPQAPPQTDNQEQSEPQPSLTFEDLLKEFQQKTTPKPAEPAYVEESKPVERVEYFKGDDSEIQDIFEKSVNQAKNSQGSSDSIKERERPVFEHFEAFDEKVEDNEFAKEIHSMLTSPDSAAKAIILSEIINRKY